MTDRFEPPEVESGAISLSRRRLMGYSAACIVAAWAAGAIDAKAQATPEAVDPAQLEALIALSQTLCGGGTFSNDRATRLLQLLQSDADLEAGLNELLATPPVEGGSLGSDQAQKTAEVILIYWYADLYNGNPLPDRGSAYYQLTTWQAMYTFSWAVCHFYGGWAQEPPTGPIVPANSVS